MSDAFEQLQQALDEEERLHAEERALAAQRRSTPHPEAIEPAGVATWRDITHLCREVLDVECYITMQAEAVVDQIGDAAAVIRRVAECLRMVRCPRGRPEKVDYPITMAVIELSALGRFAFRAWVLPRPDGRPYVVIGAEGEVVGWTR